MTISISIRVVYPLSVNITLFRLKSLKLVLPSSR